MSYHDFQPGDGTRYSIHCMEDVHGGLLVIAQDSTWRYYAGDYLKFLHGRENDYTQRAIFNYLEALQETKLHICSNCHVTWHDDGNDVVFCHACLEEYQ